MVSSLDLYYIVEDVQAYTPARIGKIYAPIWNEFYIEMQHREKGAHFLYVQVGESLEIVQEKEKVNAPSPFVMFLRKHLSQGFIKRIYQQEFERICVLEISVRGIIYHLILEFFAKGNLVLCDNDFQVLQCLHHIEMRDRTIKPGQKYVFPSPARVVPFNLSLQELQNLINTSDKENIVKTLALDFSFGGQYAEYICAQANVAKEKTKLSSTEIERLHQVMNSLKTVRPNFGQVQSVLESKQEQSWQQLILKWQKRTDKQQEYVAELEKTATDAQRKGDLIYTHYTEVEQAILSRTPTLVLEGMQIHLDPNRSVSWHAAEYYAHAKKAKRKVDTARAVYEASKEKLAEIQATPPLPKEQKKEKRTREWYEAFHWFYSSGGFLVVGGTNATTNDQVMQKHRRSDDLVFHTEAPGSPFFIVQTNGQEVDAATIAEAGKAAAAYSQQWKFGKKFAEVFYAKGKQYVKEKEDAAGTFHVVGERTKLKVPLELAIGKTSIIVGGPQTAISKLTENYILITPGEEKKADLAKKIAHKLEANPEEISRFIPAGSGKISK